MSIPTSIPEKRHRAARVIAANARNADDLAELLGMLGLTAAEGRFPPAPDVDTPCIPGPRHPSEADRDLATTLLCAVTQSLR
jgi:hypothetical protein